MNTFLLTQPIDFPIDKSGGYDRKEYPQQYLKTILEERIPDARVVVCDFRETIKQLNSYIPAADKKLQEYINGYKYAVELAKDMGLMKNLDSSSHDSRYDDSRKKHMATLREKFPEYGIALASECFSYNQPREISTFTDVKVKTYILGIIVPIGHADHRELWDIIHGIDGLFREQLAEVRTPHDRKINKNDEYKTSYITERDIAIEHLFYSRFQIPVFESFKFAPGDRFNNMPVGKSMQWKETEYNFGREDFIKFAFNKWIDTYFPKK